MKWFRLYNDVIHKLKLLMQPFTTEVMSDKTKLQKARAVKNGKDSNVQNCTIEKTDAERRVADVLADRFVEEACG